MIKKGNIIEVYNDLTGELTEGIVIYTEVDNEFPELLHIYLKADDVNLDTLQDYRFPELYWTIITISSVKQQ